MNNFTTNTYQMKREIVKFSNKLYKNSNQSESKFVTDMIYGISKSKDILLSSIAGELNENIKKAYTIDRLSENLCCSLNETIDNNYCDLVMDSLGDNPVFLIDDSDIVKPKGKKFEDLEIVRDGSSEKKEYKNGYHHTEIVGLTENMKQPISVFSKVHSSTSKDSKEIFRHYFEKQQYFVIRLKENRKVYLNHKTYKITTIRDSRKRKIKIKLMFQGEEKECYASVLKVQITAKKKWINLVLVYGLGETPMMLASNIPIKSKEDVIKIVRCYLNRWRIEEYFKFKKQEYKFENFRVRTLKAINNLNKLLSYTIGLIGILSEKINKRDFVNKIIKESKSLKDNVYLWFYQLARGIYNILKMAKTGIQDWEQIRRTNKYDGQLSLL